MSTEPLPPTSEALLDDETRPYFLWWTDVTVGGLKQRLASDDLETKAYWMGALLREANTRDVWLFVTAEQIRDTWPHLIPFLGRARAMWAWLLDLPPAEWPSRHRRNEQGIVDNRSRSPSPDGAVAPSTSPPKGGRG